MKSVIAIQERLVGAGHPVMVVAEIGINHNGDMDLACRMIDAAAEAGADAVKFQSYRTEDFVRNRKLTYTYRQGRQEITESQFELFKRCELPADRLAELKRRCDDRNVVFHATPTSETGVHELVRIGSAVLKNGSDYLTHTPLVQAMGVTGLPTVLSVGMATLAEVAAAVDTFRATGNPNLILLHCTSSYPTPPADVHLRKIETLARAFGCPVGFSDHTAGTLAAIGAVTLGACWVEKHFTIDKEMPGPDQRFSADPAELRALVAAVATAETQLGCGRIKPAVSEGISRRSFRLSCVAERPLKQGQVVCANDLTFARPGTGLPPRDAALLVGRTLRRDVAAGELLLMEDVQ